MMIVLMTLAMNKLVLASIKLLTAMITLFVLLTIVLMANVNMSRLPAMTMMHVPPIAAALTLDVSLLPRTAMTSLNVLSMIVTS
jgi:hypothetical protein